MTKEQVLEHGKVIKWFCDNPDKGVWIKDTSTNDWLKSTAPRWYEGYVYVENDEYAKYRKAQANGKTIQQSVDASLNIWNDINYKSSFSLKPEAYRIKPDKFKVGDWVTYKKPNTPILQN